MLRFSQHTLISSVALVVVGAVISIASVVFMSPSVYAADACVKIKDDKIATYYSDCANSSTGLQMKRDGSGEPYVVSQNQGQVIGVTQYSFNPIGADVVTSKTCPPANTSCSNNPDIAVTVEGRENLTNEAEQNPGGSGGTDSGETSCFIKGWGWLICPAVNFFAWIADLMYDFFANFLMVPTQVYVQGSGLHQAWQTFLGYANIVFVILFMAVIYSQLTGGGLSNYTIKRMLPRIIVTAILINMSYIICTLAIDLSNILGSGLKDTLANLAPTSDVPNMNNPGNGQEFWTNLAGTILAGGVGAAAGGIALAVSGFFPALIMLVLIIIPIIVTLIVILFILLIRQVAIVLLVVLAPLAFAARLLPNTEGLFKKWAKMFQGVLVVYPIVGGIYGASLLASGILQGVYNETEAANLGEFTIQIIAAGIVVIPLFLVPKTLKASLDSISDGKLGSMINGIGGKLSGGMKNKIDNSNFAKYSKAQAADKRARVASGAYKGKFGNLNPSNLRSKFNRGRNNNRVFNFATGGYGADLDIKRQAQERGDMQEAVNMFGGNDNLARAWAMSGGRLDKAKDLIGDDGKNLINEDDGSVEQFKRLQQAGQQNKATSHLAAAKMLSEGGKGSAEDVKAALATAAAKGADAATVESAKQSAIAAYRGAGRGDALAAMGFKENRPPTAAESTKGWSEVAAQSVHREGIKADPAGYSSYLMNGYGEKNGRSATEDAIKGFDKMEARAKNAAESHILAAASHHMGGTKFDTIEQAKAAMLHDGAGQAPIQQAAAAANTPTQTSSAASTNRAQASNTALTGGTGGLGGASHVPAGVKQYYAGGEETHQSGLVIPRGRGR